MGDDTTQIPEPESSGRADDTELALWERFLAGESTVADDALIRALSAGTDEGGDRAAIGRRAVLGALTPPGAPPTVDARAMLQRLRARRAASADAEVLPLPVPHVTHRVRRIAAATAWATAAAIMILAVTRPTALATRSIRLGLGDTGTYQAGPAERLRMRLPDGTEVLAAPNTSVRVSGPSDNRSVTVHGEAYVDANRDTVHRLIVRAGNAFLENVGARFAVRTDSDHREVRIAVATGVVLAGDTGAPWQAGRVLTRGTVGVVSAHGATRTFHPTDPGDAMVWEHGGPQLGRDQMRDELPRMSWNGA
jgi:ferric-dicitrate binding protein FerR (iron transport regulator)